MTSHPSNKPTQDPISQAHAIIAACAPDFNFDELPIPHPLPQLEFGVYYLDQPTPPREWIRDAVGRKAAQIYLQVGKNDWQTLTLYAQTHMPVLFKYFPGTIHPLVIGPLAGDQIKWTDIFAKYHASATRLPYAEYCKMLRRGAESR